jgi:hypothetical protein
MDSQTAKSCSLENLALQLSLKDLNSNDAAMQRDPYSRFTNERQGRKAGFQAANDCGIDGRDPHASERLGDSGERSQTVQVPQSLRFQAVALLLRINA